MVPPLRAGYKFPHTPQALLPSDSTRQKSPASNPKPPRPGLTTYYTPTLTTTALPKLDPFYMIKAPNLSLPPLPAASYKPPTTHPTAFPSSTLKPPVYTPTRASAFSDYHRRNEVKEGAQDKEEEWPPLFYWPEGKKNIHKDSENST